MASTNHFETFGFDTPDPWALDAFRLVYAVPRAYRPLVDAWDLRYPGTLKALDRLASGGFVGHQPGLIFDTVTGDPATTTSRRVARWRITASGRRTLAACIEDSRVFEDLFPRTNTDNLPRILRLLSCFDLDGSHARYGMSVNHAVTLSGLDERLGRWWVERFRRHGFITRLDATYADVRELVPEHWRPNRAGARQLASVAEAYGFGHLKTDFRLGRRRFLGDIELSRIGITGATDYDHDVVASRIAARLVTSDRWAGGVFGLEPRFHLPADTTARPWRFTPTGKDVLFYQPDIEMRYRDDQNRLRRLVVEYERFQSRRDAWAHIERFLGYLHTKALPFEAGTLGFVVDSNARRRSYVELIEAFCDHLLRRPTLSVANPVTLAVTTVEHIETGPEPLDMRAWDRIALPAGPTGGADTETGPALHAPEATPYDVYFTRGTSK